MDNKEKFDGDTPIYEEEEVEDISDSTAEKLDDKYADYKEKLETNTEPTEEVPLPEPASDEPEEEPEPDREIPRSKTFDENPDSVDSIMREALTDMDTVIVSMEDRTNYLKAVLNDEPVILTIGLCADQFMTEIRSRTAWEQTILYAAVKKDQDAGLVSDLSSVIIQLQKYGCALMLKNVNGKPFSDLHLKEADGLDTCLEQLQKYRVDKIESLSMPKWTLLLNALRTFETKIARMGTECLNENFWKPAD
jgi:hypothetical protein